jgi:hypothetical protein
MSEYPSAHSVFYNLLLGKEVRLTLALTVKTKIGEKYSFHQLLTKDLNM